MRGSSVAHQWFNNSIATSPHTQAYVHTYTYIGARARAHALRHLIEKNMEEKERLKEQRCREGPIRGGEEDCEEGGDTRIKR